MKQILVLVLFALTINFVSTAIYAADDRKLPTLPLIDENCKKEIKFDKEEGTVRYECSDDNTWAVFTAYPLTGRLQSIRIVLGDMTVYEWNCQYNGDEISIVDGPENGVHLNNKYRINREEWVKFFNQKLYSSYTAKKVNKSDNVFLFADSMNNGSDGGFTLLKVTTGQWEFLKKRGLKLHHMGNVLDTPWPKDFGTILMSEGFWSPEKDDFLKEKETKPEVFWVAVRTSEGSYKE